MQNEEKQLSDIGAIEIDAIELKFDGFNYVEIADRLKDKYRDLSPAYQTVRNWFMKSGKLTGFYEAYAKEQAEIRKKQAIDTFKAHINTAVRVLVSIASDKKAQESARVQACKEIINRELGEPLKRQQVEEVNNPAKDILRMAGLLDDEDREVN